MDFDDDGFAIPGTYAISTVLIGAHGADGFPVAMIESAGCDKCEKWASEAISAWRTATTGEPLNARTSRREGVIVYACPDHMDEVLDDLADEYGASVNRYEPDDLAAKVTAESKRLALLAYEASKRPPTE